MTKHQAAKACREAYTKVRNDIDAELAKADKAYINGIRKLTETYNAACAEARAKGDRAFDECDRTFAEAVKLLSS